MGPPINSKHMSGYNLPVWIVDCCLRLSKWGIIQIFELALNAHRFSVGLGNLDEK